MKSFIAACLLFICGGCAYRAEHVGPLGESSFLTPTRQLIRPAGDTVEYAGRPVDVALSPDAKRLYAKDNRGLAVFDTATMTLLQELPFGDDTGGSMHGIAVSADGDRVYATTAGNELREAITKPGGKLEWARTFSFPGPKGKDESYPTGVALDEQRGLAYVCLSRNNSLAVVALENAAILAEIPTGVAPFDVVPSADGKVAYVSNWGGRRPTDGERSADSSGTPALVDERGVASSGTISVLNLDARTLEREVPTGLHPSDLVLSGDGARLYVAESNADTVSVVDTATMSISGSILVRPDAALPFGSMPNALALDERADRLYVANGGNNAVAVVALDDKGGLAQIDGFIPAGWFPGSLALADEHLFVGNVKGIGSRTKYPESTGWNSRWHRGSVSRVTPPSLDDLRRYTAQVVENGRIPQALRAWERRAGGAGDAGWKPALRARPVPRHTGDPSVIEHVVYIIKENRTYDQVFGDLPQGNGDPSLCIFPRDLTPNHHALAEQFVLLDNYYCNGVLSADGHSWSTEGNVTGYLEKSFGGFTRSYTWGDDPLTYSSSGFIWDNVLLAGLSFRNYGEFNNSTPIPSSLSFKQIYDDYASGKRSIRFTSAMGVERLKHYSQLGSPGWNLKIPDVLRAQVFLDELAAYEKQGEFPNLTILYLPQDHTSGTNPGAPTPRAHIADNDLALGRVVEGISKSRFWPRTCIFVIEDDPQDGFDHVDGHRSLCLVISPHAKHGKVVSEFYNQTAVLHTMARMLGVPPMNQMDSMSEPMSKCFVRRPDLAPYTARPTSVPLDELNPEKTALSGQSLFWAERSLEQPFESFDMADEDTLNRILWHTMKGVETPYPAEFAGAHGKGLAALGLAPGVDAEDSD